jgi:hypothetical protein
MKHLILVILLIGCASTHQCVLSDADAGYNQAAYDACTDSAEDLDCNDIE